MTRLFITSALSLILLLAGGMAHAFKMAPIKVDFHPAGTGVSHVFRLENDGDEPIAVQVSMLERSMDIDGTEIYRDADDDFIVFPPQMVIGPRQTQSVRVKWAGDPDPRQEHSYRIVAEQLPVTLQKTPRTGAAVNLLVRYMGAIYIVPRDANARVVVGEVARERREDGGSDLVITVHNDGNTHAILGDLSVALTGTAPDASIATLVLSPDELPGMNGENVLAGHTRRFVLPWPATLEATALQAELEFTLWR